MALSELGPWEWTLLVIGAVVAGFAKTAVGSAGALAAALFALAIPARESTGALLPLLCLGDLIAVRVYHRHADWRLLLRLLPGVLPGLALGAWFLSIASDDVARRAIGLILLSACVLQLRRTCAPRADQPGRRGTTGVIGLVAGFATMTANAAGPVTTLYLLAAGLPKLQFLGTAAWFYLVVNAVKVPASTGLNLLDRQALALDALLVPALLLGAAVGTMLVGRIDQKGFERMAMGLTGLAAMALIL